MHWNPNQDCEEFEPQWDAHWTNALCPDGEYLMYFAFPTNVLTKLYENITQQKKPKLLDVGESTRIRGMLKQSTNLIGSFNLPSVDQNLSPVAAIATGKIHVIMVLTACIEGITCPQCDNRRPYEQWLNEDLQKMTRGKSPCCAICLAKIDAEEIDHVDSFNKTGKLYKVPTSVLDVTSRLLVRGNKGGPLSSINQGPSGG